VHFGTTPLGYTNSNSLPASETTHRVRGLTNGVRYYFAVKAHDEAGNQSIYSNEVNAVPSRPIDREIRIFPGLPQELEEAETGGPGDQTPQMPQ